MTHTITHCLALNWVVYNPEDGRCLCISDTGSDKILWKKSLFTSYIILNLENIEFIEKFTHQLVSVFQIYMDEKPDLNKLIINFLTRKVIWKSVIFVPIVGKQYDGHTTCHELPEHLDFVKGIRLT